MAEGEELRSNLSQLWQQLVLRGMLWDGNGGSMATSRSLNTTASAG